MHSPALRELLLNDLEDLAYNRFGNLQKKYRLPYKTLIEIRAMIQEFDPRPGSSFYQQQKTSYIIPDLAIKKVPSGFSVEVIGEIAGTMIMSSEYLDMIEGGRVEKETLEWLKIKRNEAQMVLRNIQQRKQTLYRLGLFLAEAQYEFFCFGESHIKPLIMQQVADALGIHVSTVSRAVQNKFVITPWGVYALRFFFPSALACTKSGARTFSSYAIKKRIKELIDSEDRANPLDDGVICTVLNGEGVEIKRRTIAKYRDALGIEKKSQRRTRETPQKLDSKGQLE